jgi:hypothetical protein
MVGTISEFTLLRLYLAGTTNASKLKAETYGDGLMGVTTIIPDQDGRFADTIGIAFQRGLGNPSWCKKTSVAAYGVVGMPDIRTIVNPLSQ